MGTEAWIDGAIIGGIISLIVGVPLALWTDRKHNR